MTWQPIETAPKEKPVLLYCPYEGVFMGEWWNGGLGPWRVMAHEYMGANDLAGDSIYINTATHWMPLPEPPQ